MITTRTGIFSSAQILGSGATRGKEPFQRKVIICEGETHNQKTGDDKLILEKTLEDCGYEIYCCGSKKEVLSTIDKLKNNHWKELIAVIDRDEDLENKNKCVIYWPKGRDQEMFLLRTGAFIRAIRTVSANMQWKMVPDVYKPDPFREIILASAMAWKIHLSELNLRYLHPNSIVDCLQNYESEEIKIPSNHQELCRKLLATNKLNKFPAINDIYLENQGKRTLTLIGAYIYMETSINQYSKQITKKELQKLWGQLKIRNHVSSLKRQIIKNLTDDDLHELKEEIINSQKK